MLKSHYNHNIKAIKLQVLRGKIIRIHKSEAAFLYRNTKGIPQDSLVRYMMYQRAATFCFFFCFFFAPAQPSHGLLRKSLVQIASAISA